MSGCRKPKGQHGGHRRSPCPSFTDRRVALGSMAFADFGSRSVDEQLRAWLASLGRGPARFDVDEVRAQGRARALARARDPGLARVRDRVRAAPGLVQADRAGVAAGGR